MLILAAVALFSFTGGWEVEDWRIGSKQAAILQAQIADHQKKEDATKKLTTTYEQQLADLRTSNAKLSRSKHDAKDVDCQLPDDIRGLLKNRTIASTSP